MVGGARRRPCGRRLPRHARRRLGHAVGHVLCPRGRPPSTIDAGPHPRPQSSPVAAAASLTFYEQRLGFSRDFVYEDFYASVSRDRAVIHLKCAPKLEAERTHRRSGEHLDAYLAVSGVAELHQEFIARRAPITKPLEQRPWGARDFYVQDPDGYILCFSEAV